MIVSCGEALIDFVPATTADGRAAYVPSPGGSPFNIAVALGRLGVPAGFLGGVSSDFFGDQLVAALQASGVVTRYVLRLERPSTLAFVSLGTGEPQYVFYDAEAAHRFWAPDRELQDDVTMLHFGSIALLGQPAAERFEQLMQRNAGRRILCFDPNVRPGVVTDEPSYRARLGRFFALADIIKISAADLAWLAPGREPQELALEWVGAGAALVVVTLGSDGALAVSRLGSTRFPAVPVDVVDTVGAGDSFMGALLAALAKLGVASQGDVRELDRASQETAVAFAIRASALTCSRRGADPPWEREIALRPPVGEGVR